MQALIVAGGGVAAHPLAARAAQAMVAQEIRLQNVTV
jgi:hypothetical protein